MKLIDLNRDGGIGANALFLKIGGFRLLVDSGLNPKKVGLEAMPDFSVLDEEKLDLVILTHAHLDHVGSLPVLLRRHPETSALMSLPTHTLAKRMLHNSCNVMKRQREEVSIPEYPLFTHSEIDRISDRFQPTPFFKPLVLRSGDEELEVTLYPAGHVPGACGVRLVHGDRRILITGDVLFEPQRVIKGARLPREEFDTVIMETTRGGVERARGKDRSSEIERLLETINRVIDSGGSCLIPVFALGRMQEMLSIFREARRNRELVDCPIFCAGLGMDLANYFDELTRKTGLLDFRLKIIKDLQVSRPPRNLVPGKDVRQKGLYLLSSGMLMENTPSYQLAASLIGHPRNAICYVGYCDPETPGGRMLLAEPGEEFLFDSLDFRTTIRAEIDHFELSGHADRDELLEYSLRARPRAVVLTHGDPEAREWFARAFASADPEIRVFDPPPLTPTEV